MRLILFSLLALTAMFTPVWGKPAKERHLFLLIGQSNMAGRAKLEDEDRKPIENAYLWHIGEKKWGPAVAPFNIHSPSRKDAGMQRLNCGPSFARAYLDAYPGVEVGIICAARKTGATVEALHARILPGR